MADTETRTGDVDWYLRTEHCGRCGQPGDFCVCTTRNPCGCGDYHPMGSGLAPDALEAFRTAGPDQGGLW